MRPLYIFDIDGTLANIEHRLHYIKDKKNQDWKSFFKACVDDKPNKPIVKILNNLSLFADVWFLSGRSDEVEQETCSWLFANTLYCGLSSNINLIMRAEGDYTPDDQLKQRFYDNMLDVDKKRLVCVFDDRKRVVDMWRRNGVTCLQVADGNF